VVTDRECSNKQLKTAAEVHEICGCENLFRNHGTLCDLLRIPPEIESSRLAEYLQTQIAQRANTGRMLDLSLLVRRVQVSEHFGIEWVERVARISQHFDRDWPSEEFPLCDPPIIGCGFSADIFGEPDEVRQLRELWESERVSHLHQLFAATAHRFFSSDYWQSRPSAPPVTKSYIYRPGSALQTHIHPFTQLTGVYYCNADSRRDGARLVFGGKDVRAPAGSDQPYHEVDVQSGELLIFPAYLAHEALPFRGTGRRVVILFDY